MRDCSSNPSTESNSRASQIELLPSKDTGQHRTQHSSNNSSEDFDRPDSEYVGDSENNDTDFLDSIVHPAPNFENILGDLEFADDGTDSLPASPHKYQRHPNSYLPTHATSTANTSPDHTWNERDQHRQICDLSDDEVMTYGFPPQGGRGFHVPVDVSGMDNMSMSVGGYTSTNASFSDISGAVCEIDDSEACSDGDYEGVVVAKPPVFSNERFCSTHL